MDKVKLINEIDEVTRLVRENFSDLPEEQLNLKPAPERWSIAQVLDHIITTNRSYFPIIENIRLNKNKVPITGKFGFLADLFGKLILKATAPDRRRRMQTFPVWQPSDESSGKEILQKFFNEQEKLKHLISDNEDLINKGIIISSPANKYIVYRLGKAFEIITAHEKRHYAQAYEVLEQLKNNNKV